MYTIEWLLKKYASEKVKFIFFWKNPEKDIIDKGIFSQWMFSPFTVEGKKYLTAEHWMMAQKALLFNDTKIEEKILKTSSPASVKSLGKQVQGFNEEIWKKQRFSLVVQGNLHKFSQNISLKEFLLKTGDKVLVEASPLDKIWGVGLAEDNPIIENPNQWKGRNLLGFALMEARDLLKIS